MSVINGKVLQGQTVNDHKFQGVTTLNQISDYGLMRPTLVEKVNLKTGDPGEKIKRQVHNDVQRRFDPARIKRAAEYSIYIESVELDGSTGGTPAITIYHQDKLSETEGGVVIPYSAILTAIDGETQTEARFMLRDGYKNPKTGVEITSIPTSGDTQIAITLYHGIPYEAAKQILHDYNSYAKPVTEAQMYKFNNNGKLTIALNAASKLSGLADKHFNRKGAKATKTTKVADKQLLNCVAGYVLNGSGLSKTAAPYFKVMNTPQAADVPQVCIDGVAEFIRNAASNPTMGQANASVWQVAGVLLASGRKPETINWAKGVQAYEATMIAGRGGEKIDVKTRLSQIAQAM